MAVIVPNAGNTTGGNKFASIVQAEPDSLDIEILGNIGSSGVLEGCLVSPSLVSPSNRVVISSGTVVLNGVSYPVDTGEVFLRSFPSARCYEVVIVRIINGNAVPMTVQGNDAEVGNTYPLTANRLPVGTIYDSEIHLDLNTDVVVAALYREGGQSVLSPNIVDKRAMLKSALINRGTTVPLPGTGSVGDLYFRTSLSGSVNSGVYVRTTFGWVELASAAGVPRSSQSLGESASSFIPVGGVVIWPSPNTPPEGFVEANGQTLSASSYPELFSAYSYTYGGSGDSFRVPNYNNVTLRGSSSPLLVGTVVGQDVVTLRSFLAKTPASGEPFEQVYAYDAPTTNNVPRSMFTRWIVRAL